MYVCTYMCVKVFTEKSEAFDERIVDGEATGEGGDMEGGLDEGAAEAQARKRRLLAMRAHLEHEIDSVSLSSFAVKKIQSRPVIW